MTDTLIDREPVAVFLAGLAGVVDAGIVAATGLGWLDLTAEQATGVVGFVTVTAGLVAGMLRGVVRSPATVNRETAP